MLKLEMHLIFLYQNNMHRPELSKLQRVRPPKNIAKAPQPPFPTSLLKKYIDLWYNDIFKYSIYLYIRYI